MTQKLNYCNSQCSQWTPDYTVNTAADINIIAELVKDAFTAFHDESDPHNDALSNILSEMYGLLYPGASRTLGLDPFGHEHQKLDRLLTELTANSHNAGLVVKITAEIREQMELICAMHDIPGLDGVGYTYP